LEHIFTPQEAGRVLEQLRPIVERMVAHRRALAQAQARQAELVAQIASNGGDGLLDFPARRGDEDVLLCWKLGEDEIAYWHGLEEGFAGRKPLPF
jgi:hypothetical protein